MTRITNMEHVEVLRQAAAVLRESAKQHRANNCMGHSGMCDGMAADLDAAIAALSAPQPPAEAQPCGCGEATCTVPWEPGCGLGKSEQHAEAQPASDGGFTAADMMDARQEGRKEAQQPTACVACEGAPVFENSPCAVCGQQPAAVDGADAKDAEIERLRAEREVIGAEAVKYADKSGRLEAKAERLAEALRELVALGHPRDPAIIAARAALRDHDQEVGNG